MEVYTQSLNKEPLDFFVSELEKCLIELEKIFFLFYILIPNKSKFFKKITWHKTFIQKRFNKTILKMYYKRW